LFLLATTRRSPATIWATIARSAGSSCDSHPAVSRRFKLLEGFGHATGLTHSEFFPHLKQRTMLCARLHWHGKGHFPCANSPVFYSALPKAPIFGATSATVAPGCLVRILASIGQKCFHVKHFDMIWAR
jgi:hypothetical protein